ncbi:DUF2290 domain-containing protein [Nonomuraea sp. NPDC048881]|uniref:DUF2290 domain-containing protein n=1 Tax=Nonomuraea sp. NPDC048881 TaxID=3155030 RepID=UPI0033EB087C
MQNVLDYLDSADLALYVNPVALTPDRVSWHAYNPAAEFMTSRQHATIKQYRHWLRNGMYSALLYDASILQITYTVSDGKVIGHRLAYVPCPFDIDQDLLRSGEPVDDIIGLYDRAADVALRSPVRFDYDPATARAGHPAAHLTINSPDCRIACVAPLHVQRFVDFVFRHFYQSLWKAHQPFFAAAAWRHLGDSIIDEEDRHLPHVTWNTRAVASHFASF